MSCKTFGEFCFFLCHPVIKHCNFFIFLTSNLPFLHLDKRKFYQFDQKNNSILDHCYNYQAINNRQVKYCFILTVATVCIDFWKQSYMFIFIMYGVFEFQRLKSMIYHNYFVSEASHFSDCIDGIICLTDIIFVLMVNGYLYNQFDVIQLQSNEMLA